MELQPVFVPGPCLSTAQDPARCCPLEEDGSPSSVSLALPESPMSVKSSLQTLDESQNVTSKFKERPIV